MTREELIAELADVFDDAITDSMDIDWRTIDGARACVEVLLADSELLTALAKLT
jgi:hypothetical protein